MDYLVEVKYMVGLCDVLCNMCFLVDDSFDVFGILLIFLVIIVVDVWYILEYMVVSVIV